MIAGKTGAAREHEDCPDLQENGRLCRGHGEILNRAKFWDSKWWMQFLPVIRQMDAMPDGWTSMATESLSSVFPCGSMRVDCFQFMCACQIRGGKSNYCHSSLRWCSIVNALRYWTSYFPLAQEEEGQGGNWKKKPFFFFLPHRLTFLSPSESLGDSFQCPCLYKISFRRVIKDMVLWSTICRLPPQIFLSLGEPLPSLPPLV